MLRCLEQTAVVTTIALEEDAPRALPAVVTTITLEGVTL